MTPGQRLLAYGPYSVEAGSRLEIHNRDGRAVAQCPDWEWLQAVNEAVANYKRHTELIETLTRQLAAYRFFEDMVMDDNAKRRESEC